MNSLYACETLVPLAKKTWEDPPAPTGLRSFATHTRYLSGTWTIMQSLPRVSTNLPEFETEVWARDAEGGPPFPGLLRKNYRNL